MIKRPLVWGIIVFIIGILLAWYKTPLLYLALIMLGGWLIIPLLHYKKVINSKDSFFWLLPILILIGFLAMRDRMKPVEMDMAFDEKAECRLIGEITMIVKKPGKIAYYLKDNLVELVDGTRYQVEGLIVNTYLNEYQDNQKSKTNQISQSSQIQNEFQIGNLVSVSGIIKKFSINTNPGEFNEKFFYRIQNISYKVNAKEISLAHSQYSKLHFQLNKIKDHLIQVYNSILSEKEAGIIVAMVLGSKHLLDDEIKTLYQGNGISHILAISGLHISMIGAAVYLLLRKLRMGLYGATILSILFIYSYGILTGFSVSTKRAVIMYSLMLMAKLIGKTFDSLSALSLSAFIILLQNPMELFQAGFLLSFGAVLGIVLVLPCLNQLYEPKTVVLKAIYVSISAQIFTLPFVLYFFFQIPIYSVFTNIIILPFTSILMITALLAGLLGLIYLPLGVFIAGGANYILKYYEIVCSLCNKLPGKLLTLGRPGAFRIIAYLIIILVFIIVAKTYNRKRLMILILLAVGVLVISGPRKGLTITMLDVGQGEAIYMETKKGTTFLIDGGSIDVSSVGTYRIQPFLLSKGVDKIDYAIVTHEDKDHISGLIEICKEGKVKIRNLVLPKIDKSRNAIDIIGEGELDNYGNLEALAIEKNINIMYIKAGDYIREGRLNITCLHPREGYNYSTTNDYSTVLSVTYGEFDMLLTGDVELDGERAIINSLLNDKYVDENLVNSGYEVLKVAHHGSKNSTSEEFISIIKPDLSLISCGKNNRYGHPHEELLDRLDEAGSQVIITYESGAITIRTDGDRGVTGGRGY